MAINFVNKLTLQIALTIIITGVIITVFDNIIEAQRLEDVSNEATFEREKLLNQTITKQDELAEKVEQHNNDTLEIFEKLTSGVDRQDEITAKLDQILNQTKDN